MSGCPGHNQLGSRIVPTRRPLEAADLPSCIAYSVGEASPAVVSGLRAEINPDAIGKTRALGEFEGSRGALMESAVRLLKHAESRVRRLVQLGGRRAPTKVVSLDLPGAPDLGCYPIFGNIASPPVFAVAELGFV